MHLKIDYKYCPDESKVIKNMEKKKKRLYKDQWQQGS